MQAVVVWSLPGYGPKVPLAYQKALAPEAAFPAHAGVQRQLPPAAVPEAVPSPQACLLLACQLLAAAAAAAAAGELRLRCHTAALEDPLPCNLNLHYLKP